MSCRHCVNQGKINCNPAPNEHGGCENYMKDRPEDENYFYDGLFDDEVGYNESEDENG